MSTLQRCVMSAVKREQQSSSDSEDDRKLKSVYVKYDKWASDSSFSEDEDVTTRSAAAQSESRSSRRRSRGGAQNRNAVMARENRIKKKMYVETLEKERDYYKKNYRETKSSLKKYKKKIKALVADYTHLRNLVRNESQISRLLVGINSSLRNDRQRRPSPPFVDHPPTPSPDADTLWRDEDPMLPTPDAEVSSLLRDSLADQVGICLHFANDTLSIGSCPNCNYLSSLEDELFF